MKQCSENAATKMLLTEEEERARDNTNIYGKVGMLNHQLTQIHTRTHTT